jgi:glutaredoxin
MDILSPPSKMGYTVYCKSGCPNCINIKKLIKDNFLLFKEINCDEYLFEDREACIRRLQLFTGNQDKITFPLVFYDGRYIGGLLETNQQLVETWINADADF